MKKIALIIAAAAAAFAAQAQEPADSLAIDVNVEASDTVASDASAKFTFTDVKLVPTTSVKNQNKSGTCWCFAGTSFMEDELLRKTGREYDLSEMYTVRRCYLDKADRYIRMYGIANFTQGGGIHDVGYVWDTYGVVPEEAYPGLNYGEKDHNHYEMEAAMQGFLKGVAAKPGKRLSTAWKPAFQGIVDAYFGPEPVSFTYEGKTYTPKTFAASLPLNMDDYVAVTSFTHHPFYKPFVLEIPDNWMAMPYQNVPLDELIAIIDNALDNGYSVMWAADVSEGGFKWTEGFAVMPEEVDTQSLDDTELARWVKLSAREREDKRFDVSGPCQEMVITQDVRQDMFDRQETTDDHGMVIVGRAVDQFGNPFYKVKNSWDTNQVYDGYFYASLPYIQAKTMGIMVNKEALPKDIAKKLK